MTWTLSLYQGTVDSQHLMVFGKENYILDVLEAELQI